MPAKYIVARGEKAAESYLMKRDPNNRDNDLAPTYIGMAMGTVKDMQDAAEALNRQGAT